MDANFINALVGALKGGANKFFAPDAERNDQMNLARGLSNQGIAPQHALALSQLLAAHPYNTDPNVQRAFLNQLKSQGYLSHQAY